MRSLVILLDSVRRANLGCYGAGPEATPNLDRFAQDAVTFDKHYVGSMPCMPARRDLFTGRMHFLHNRWGGLEPFDETWVQALRRAGVFTHLITDHYHYFHLGGENYADQFSTWDFQRGQENDRWISEVVRPSLPPLAAASKLNAQNLSNRAAQQDEETYSGPRCVQSAVDWLQRNGRHDDWSLMLEVFDPHEPFLVPKHYLQEVGDDYAGPLFDWPAYAAGEIAPELRLHIQRRYQALLLMTDRWLGRVFDELAKQGILDDTLVVVTTDHGLCLGERGLWMKNYFPVYQELAHIPLLMRLPGAAAGGQRCTSLTQTQDLCRTLCSHHAVPAPAHASGHALQAVLSGSERRSALVFGYFGMAVNCCDGRHVYFRNPVTADNTPLAAYTAMPTTADFWRAESAFPQITCGRFFDYCKQFPVYRLPVTGDDCRHLWQAAGGIGRHQLFDLVHDPQQEHPIADPVAEQTMQEHLRRCLLELEAPPEQFQRLGLC